MRKFLLLFVGVVHGILAQQSVSTQVQLNTEQHTQASKKAVPLRGIRVVGEHTMLRSDSVSGVYIDKNIQVPGSAEELKRTLASYAQGQEITREHLLNIKNAILGYYTDHNNEMVVVEIPEQDISSGIVTFVVTKAKIGSVCYRGNRWFSKERVAKKLALRSGEPIDENNLRNRLSWLNENPFHYTDVIISPGKERKSSDLEIVTQDRFPLRFYVGADNTGIESTGTARYYGGLTWGDAFFIDDFLNYQFTTNNRYHRFHSHSLNYTSYLPWQHWLMIYGGYARIHPTIPDFDGDGKEAQASLRYKIPFKPLYTSFQHQFYFGFDYKYITNILFFVAEITPQAAQNSIVNVSQAMAGYMLESKRYPHEFTARAEIFASPAKWLPHQTTNDYNSLRDHAKARYIYGTLTVGEIYTFATKDSISALLRVQGTPNTLIPSEQFKLGGHNSVRGYEESVFISDNGVIANFEARARPFTFFKKVKDELTFLAFMDYGWGYNYHTFDGIRKAATLWSIGPGARYTIGPYLTARADYGFKLHHVHFDDHKLGMWHVAATLSY